MEETFLPTGLRNRPIATSTHRQPEFIAILQEQLSSHNPLCSKMPQALLLHITCMEEQSGIDRELDSR